MYFCCSFFCKVIVQFSTNPKHTAIWSVSWCFLVFLFACLSVRFYYMSFLFLFSSKMINFFYCRRFLVFFCFEFEIYVFICISNVAYFVWIIGVHNNLKLMIFWISINEFSANFDFLWLFLVWNACCAESGIYWHAFYYYLIGGLLDRSSLVLLPLYSSMLHGVQLFQRNQECIFGIEWFTLEFKKNHFFYHIEFDKTTDWRKNVDFVISHDRLVDFSWLKFENICFHRKFVPHLKCHLNKSTEIIKKQFDYELPKICVLGVEQHSMVDNFAQ